jgi:hypothetical protein
LFFFFFFFFSGGTMALRLRNRNFVNYASGFAVVHTTRPRFGGQTSADFEQVSVLDLDNFLSSFGDLDGLHRLVSNKCAEIQAEWKATNGAKEMMGSRSPVQKLFTLANYSWVSKKQKQERACYDLNLNTFNFTMKNQREAKPVIRLKDVTVIADYIFILLASKTRASCL